MISRLGSRHTIKTFEKMWWIRKEEEGEEGESMVLVDKEGGGGGGRRVNGISRTPFSDIGFDCCNPGNSQLGVGSHHRRVA